MINVSDLSVNEEVTESESKDSFYKRLKAAGIDFDDIDSDSRLPKYMIKVIKNEPKEYNKFNNVLYKLNKDKIITIVDSMAYLVEDWFEPNILIKCLDEMNYYSLMNGLKKKYLVDRSSSDLENFFV
jgi:stage III sporulation protein SpoIIIAA